LRIELREFGGVGALQAVVGGDSCLELREFGGVGALLFIIYLAFIKFMLLLCNKAKICHCYCNPVEFFINVNQTLIIHLVLIN